MLEAPTLRDEREPHLFGRAREIAAVASSLGRRGTFVTLVGPGGIGKTRIAKVVAVRLAREREGTTHIVDLTPVASLDALVSQVSRALGVVIAPTCEAREAIEIFRTHLASAGPGLLVLDNAEHVLTEVATMVRAWSTTPSALGLLVTSREPLGLDEERLVEVGPLPIDSAVDLFVARVEVVRLGYAPSPAERETIARIVSAIGAFPLAVELAAACVDVLSIDQIEARFDHAERSLDVVQSGRREGSARHASLRAAIHESWRLLDPIERRVFAACSVFRGGFTVEALESVVASEGCLDVVRALRRKSLVTQLDERLSLYAPIHAYAATCLEASGDGDRMRARHAAYFVCSAEEWARVEEGLDAPADLTLLARERDNVLAAYEHMRERDPELAARAVIALHPLLIARGPVSVLESLVASAMTRSSLRPALAARLLCVRGRARRLRGPIAAGEPDLLLACQNASGSAPPEHAEALRLLSLLYSDLGRFEPAIEAARQAVAILEGLERRGSEAIARVALVIALFRAGRLTLAYEEGQRALVVERQVNLPRVRGVAAFAVGAVLQDLGDLERARGMFGEALDSQRRAGDLRHAGIAAMGLACIAWEQGDDERAEGCASESLQMLRTCGDLPNQAYLHGYQAIFFLGRGDAAAASAPLEESLRLFAISESPRSALVFECARLVLEAWVGRSDYASRRLAELRDDPTLADWVRTTLELYSATVEALDARASATRGDARAARRAIASAQKTLGAQASLRSVEARTALRGLTAALHEAERAMVGAEPDPPRGARLTIAGDGAWFQVTEGARVSLGRQETLRRVLARLLRAQKETRGEAVSVDDLLAAAWPGERIARDAATMRVYTAIKRLRRAGLEGFILTRGGAYLIDPRVELDEERQVGS